MDEDDTATPPDGSSGGGRRIVDHTSVHRSELERRWKQINDEIDRLEQQQGNVGDNPQLDAQIANLYDQHRIITLEQDYGSGYDAYDPDAIENPDDVLPPQPPHPPPPPPPPPNANFVE